LREAISERQIRRIRQTAIERGWNPQANAALEEAHLIDKPRTGRPKKHNKAQDEAFIQLAISSAPLASSVPNISQEKTLSISMSVPRQSDGKSRVKLS
jgi:hypothetical protein